MSKTAPKKRTSKQKKKERRDNSPLSIVIKLGISAILITLALLLPKLASGAPELIEKVFSRGWYVGVSVVFGAINSVLPFSLTEVIVAALIIAAVVLIVVTFIRALNRKFSSARFFAWLVSFVLVASIMLFNFYVLWGFNYHRETTASIIGLNVRKYSVDELYTLCEQLRDDAITARAAVSENENGVFVIADYRESFSRISVGYAALGLKYDVFAKKFFPAKSVLFSKAMSYTGTAGMFVPYTMEANVNIDQPSLLIPAGAAHENAHYYGIARENEANFVAYLACLKSGDPSIAYSGSMLALIYAGNQLSSANSDKYSELYGTYTEGMRRDLTDYSEYWKAFEGKIQDAAQGMNDSYLKHNSQESGVKSYGEMVDLLLAYYIDG